MQAQNQQYHADLVAAETRADRLRSSTVQAMQARTSEKQQQSEAEEKSEAATPQAPASPPVSGLVSSCECKSWTIYFSNCKLTAWLNLRQSSSAY